MSIFTEDNGTSSMIRVLTPIVAIGGLLVGLIPAILGTLTMEAVTLSLGLVTLGLTGKVVQKGLEA